MSSISTWPTPWAMPPQIWPSSNSAFMTVPTSSPAAARPIVFEETEAEQFTHPGEPRRGAAKPASSVT
jgi:hypothetical protein